MRRYVPLNMRQAFRRLRHAYQIKHRTFGDNDPLFRRLPEWVHAGDVALDVGAAVGTFAVTLSELVGPTGRVISFEPLPQQFEILATNTSHAAYPNITCLELAIGSITGYCSISVPITNGVPNWYMAHIATDGLKVLLAALDDLPLPRPVAFLKVDTEGHDLEVLRGAQRLIRDDRPVLFVETADKEMRAWLTAYGYVWCITDGDSPNTVFLPPQVPQPHDPPDAIHTR